MSHPKRATSDRNGGRLQIGIPGDFIPEHWARIRRNPGRHDPGIRTRRTIRLADSQRQIGLSLGGEAGARLAARLAMPVSGDTLLRLIRTVALAPIPPPRVIGIDDWAWRRGHRYGSIICDLERRRVVDLLPDRTVEAVRAWLAARPGITVIARDRAGAYAQATTAACPDAMQVADRWHLMENVSAALLDAVQRSMRRIRDALGAASLDPALLTCAERRQHEGFLRRAAADAVIRRLAASGVPIKEIVRRTGHSRKVVRTVVRGGRMDVFRVRASTLDAFLPRLDAEWENGCRNGAELWRRLRAAGFTGALRVVSEWATRRRRADSTPGALPCKPPSARTVARLLVSQRDRLPASDARLVAVVEEAVPALRVAAALVEGFQNMLRTKTAALDTWLTDAAESVLAAFAAGIAADRDAVAAAITEPWSNGQTEGQITKLKLLKQQMYGRAGLDLLRARLIAA